MPPQITPEMKLVTKCGAIGGVISALYTYMAGATYGLPWWIATPACVPLGAVAAVVAVFWITPTDTSRSNQLVAYALLCGIFWKPVIDGGKALVTQQIDAKTSQSKTASSVNALGAARPEDVPAKVKDVAAETSTLLKASDDLDNPKAKDEATTQATQAIDIVVAQAQRNPEATANALREIRTAATKWENKEVEILATAQLQRLVAVRPPTVQSNSPAAAN